MHYDARIDDKIKQDELEKKNSALLGQKVVLMEKAVVLKE
jgi:hypothetical protein